MRFRPSYDALSYIIAGLIVLSSVLLTILFFALRQG